MVTGNGRGEMGEGPPLVVIQDGGGYPKRYCSVEDRANFDVLRGRSELHLGLIKYFSLAFRFRGEYNRFA